MCRDTVSNCQELYFLEDTETPILQADASDYGIGGYLYMIVNRVYAQTRFCAFDLRFHTVVRGKRSFHILFRFNRIQGQNLD